MYVINYSVKIVRIFFSSNSSQASHPLTNSILQLHHLFLYWETFLAFYNSYKTLLWLLKTPHLVSKTKLQCLRNSLADQPQLLLKKSKPLPNPRTPFQTHLFRPIIPLTNSAKLNPRQSSNPPSFNPYIPRVIRMALQENLDQLTILGYSRILPELRLGSSTNLRTSILTTINHQIRPKRPLSSRSTKW